ncbi:MAG: TIGR01777 family protein [Kineosporiaceae bacterium]|nr:TIGR01777 family protein [Kineosporiaceae bacterium]MBK7624491.1 TIGR01777 family protein [Kineosporiaceae bacterium]MBK8077139.1 TIGR01777 family protein [Kineosporiaceae bacterium]
MRIAIAGSSGLMGTELVTRLTAEGHEAVRLVRRPARTPHEITWDPDAGGLPSEALADVDGVVNLAGAGVGDKRWTDAYKRLLVSSRVNTTNVLVDAMLALGTPPPVLVNASAQGFYGDRGEEVLTETSPPGEGFLTDLVMAWEEAARRAETGSGGAVRVATLRSGLVLSPHGGAFGRMLPLAKLGLGGPLGTGRQWWSWITLADQVSAIIHLLQHEVSGPVNVCTPHPARQAEVAAALGRALHRPALLPAPSFALRTVLGEFSTEVLGSTRMTPEVLQRSGFAFAHPDLETALPWLLAP